MCPYLLWCQEVFRRLSFFPKGPELSLSQVNYLAPYLRWLGDVVWVICPLPLLHFVFVFFADSSWKRALISGVWLGGFSVQNQAGLGLGVDDHGALESGQCIAGR